jgi:hypothetical protein
LVIQQLLIGSKESYRQGDFDDETSPGTLVGVETEAVDNSATFEGFSAPIGGPPGENSGSKAKSASGGGALNEPFVGAMAGKSVQEQILSNHFW